MADTENIEAKLAAYVEGELDALERAELEKHLAGNVQHQALLEELKKMRFVLRDLPRESAPAEISERVQQQIERSLLLDDAASDRGTVRLNRWPSLLVAASIGILAVGLGVVVYMALPGQSVPNVLVSRNPTEALPEAPPAVAPRRGAETDRKDRASENSEQAPAGQFGPVAAGPDTSGKKESARTMPMRDTTGKATVADADLDRAKSKQDSSGPARLGYNESVTLVIDSANAKQTEQALGDYLSLNQFNWQVKADGSADRKGLEESAAPQQKLNDRELQSNMGLAVNNQPEANAAPSGAAQPPQRYQVQNISPAQVAELRGVLLQNGGRIQTPAAVGGATGTVLGFDHAQSKADAPETTQTNRPATTEPAIEPGEVLAITVDELVGPGVDKTNTVRVSGDGTIALPMVEPIRVAGLDQAQAKSRIADVYRDAQLIPSPRVTVERTLASTQPAEAPATRPAVGSLAGVAGGGTERAGEIPAASTTAPARVDLVIVVQPLAANSAPSIESKPAALPVTQPATLPAN